MLGHYKRVLMIGAHPGRRGHRAADRPGPGHGGGGGLPVAQPGRGRPEPHRPRAGRGARPDPDRGAAGRPAAGRRPAVLHPRLRLRLLQDARRDLGSTGRGTRSSRTSCGSSGGSGRRSSSRSSAAPRATATASTRPRAGRPSRRSRWRATRPASPSCSARRGCALDAAQALSQRPVRHRRDDPRSGRRRARPARWASRITRSRWRAGACTARRTWGGSRASAPRTVPARAARGSDAGRGHRGPVRRDRHHARRHAPARGRPDSDGHDARRRFAARVDSAAGAAASGRAPRRRRVLRRAERDLYPEARRRPRPSLFRRPSDDQRDTSSGRSPWRQGSCSSLADDDRVLAGQPSRWTCSSGTRAPIRLRSTAAWCPPALWHVQGELPPETTRSARARCSGRTVTRRAGHRRRSPRPTSCAGRGRASMYDWIGATAVRAGRAVRRRRSRCAGGACWTARRRPRASR